MEKPNKQALIHEVIHIIHIGLHGFYVNLVDKKETNVLYTISKSVFLTKKRKKSVDKSIVKNWSVLAKKFDDLSDNLKNCSADCLKKNANISLHNLWLFETCVGIMETKEHIYEIKKYSYCQRSHSRK